MSRDVIYLVVPCYNEQEVLPETSKRLKEKMTSLMETGVISKKSRVVFVNDGSRDRTWEMIERLHEKDELFSGVNLSRNRGHQNAVLAGLMTVRELCDAAITLDADLQDDVNAIDSMVKKFKEGCEVVYGVRSSRKTDTAFKRTTAQAFYKLMKAMGVDTVYNHADYRLMSRRVLDCLLDYKEVNLFLRGMIPQIGFKSDIVTYERAERFAGESKYPLKKMIAFALDGITSFSVKPLSLIIFVGIALCLLSIIGFVWGGITLCSTIATTALMRGYVIICASAVALIGGIVTVCMGVVGEYVGKIYKEVKARPRYTVADFINKE